MNTKTVQQCVEEEWQAAGAALKEAQKLPAGPERFEALKRAGLLRYEVDRRRRFIEDEMDRNKKLVHADSEKRK